MGVPVLASPKHVVVSYDGYAAVSDDYAEALNMMFEMSKHEVKWNADDWILFYPKEEKK